LLQQPQNTLPPSKLDDQFFLLIPLPCGID
jgi:hypothetical protein